MKPIERLGVTLAIDGHRGALSASSAKLGTRIAGPLVRFKRAIRCVADGEFPEPLRTRRGDYLKREVTDLNAMVQSLDTRVQAIRDAAAGIDGAIEDCRGSDGQLPDALTPVVQSTRELHSAVARFRNEDR